MSKGEELTFIGDPHAQPDNHARMRKLFALVEKLGNTSVWLGDLLHTKELIRGACFNLYYEYFSASKLHHYLLVGNHDWFSDACKDHALKGLASLPNVTVVDVPTLYKGVLGLLPFYRNQEDFKEAVEATIEQKPKFLAIHQGVTGFDYGNGFIATEEVPEEYIQSLKVDLVISGHFHKYQDRGKLIYLGTPFSHSFGEANQKKFLGILNLASGAFETLDVNLPAHISLEIDVSKKSQVEELIQTLNEQAKGDDFIRVILKGSAEKILAFPQADYPTVKFIPRPTESQQTSEFKETQSSAQHFVKWAKEIKKLDEATVKRGLKFLEDAA